MLCALCHLSAELDQHNGQFVSGTYYFEELTRQNPQICHLDGTPRTGIHSTSHPLIQIGFTPYLQTDQFWQTGIAHSHHFVISEAKDIMQICDSKQI